MGRPRPARQITLTTLLVTITIALTVGWEILVVREFRALVEGFTIVHWLLLILGSLFFVAIITATILQTVWLIREIKTNQRQSDFIDAVTHELHTPLASLRLYVDTLAKPDLDEAHRFEFASIMSDDLERLQRTIDRVLDAARSESRRPAPVRVDLVRVLDECVQEARARHGLGPDRVRLLAPVRAAVRGDAEQLRLVFRNLIENAIRYAGERVDVDVRVRAAPGRRVEVEVADQGVGIPPSALARIFQRFQRLPQSAARRPHGLGLGLYIVRNVVKAHGGRIHAESEGPGTGSRFVVRLPGTLEEHAHPAG